MGWGIKISVPSISQIGKNINRAAINVGKQSEQTFKDAGRGEIGKWAGGIGQSAYNAALAAPRAVISGNYSKEIQRFAGSAANLYTYGGLDYASKSNFIKKTLNDKTVDSLTLGLSGDLYSASRGTSTLSRDGSISNYDRNRIFQGVVKSVAIGGAVYAGSTYFGASSVAPGTLGAQPIVDVTAATAVPGATPILSAGAGVTSTEIGLGTATAASTPWYTSLAQGFGTGLGVRALTAGQQAAQNLGDGADRFLDGFLNGNSRSPSYVTDSQENSSFLPPSSQTNAVGKVLIYGALLASFYYLYKHREAVA